MSENLISKGKIREYLKSKDLAPDHLRKCIQNIMDSFLMHQHNIDLEMYTNDFFYLGELRNFFEEIA